MGPTDDPATARTIADAVAQNITFADQSQAAKALQDFYQAAGSIGADAAGEQLATDAITTLPSVQELIDASLQRVQGIVDTQRDIISTAVRDGVMNGSPASTIASQINDTLLDPARSQLIAVTEGNRAYAAGTIDSYRAAGITHTTGLPTTTPALSVLRWKMVRPTTSGTTFHRITQIAGAITTAVLTQAQTSPVRPRTLSASM